MKDAADHKTADLIDPPKRRPGRPPKGDRAMTEAERKAAYRRTSGKGTLTVELSQDTLDRFNAYLAERPHKKRGQVLEKLILSQLLRER